MAVARGWLRRRRPGRRRGRRGGAGGWSPLALHSPAQGGGEHAPSLGSMSGLGLCVGGLLLGKTIRFRGSFRFIIFWKILDDYVIIVGDSPPAR